MREVPLIIHTNTSGMLIWVCEIRVTVSGIVGYVYIEKLKEYKTPIMSSRGSEVPTVVKVSNSPRSKGPWIGKWHCPHSIASCREILLEVNHSTELPIAQYRIPEKFKIINERSQVSLFTGCEGFLPGSEEHTKLVCFSVSSSWGSGVWAGRVRVLSAGASSSISSPSAAASSSCSCSCSGVLC